MTDSRTDKMLKMIVAIVQRGKADEVVREAIRAGAPAATVMHGRGQGVREKLGVLGLAILPEKEIILIVLDETLMPPVIKAMATKGKLDQPGFGALFVLPVDQAMGMIADSGS